VGGRLLNKVLVANRGEIALRVIRACRELGMGAVAVYSEADRRAPHVLAADEAVLLGPAPAAESYLRIDRILEAARSRGCDAIHPGYGFLAERAAFARAVEEAGLIFVGPPAAAIEAMGDKTRARQAMTAAGVPVVPGTDRSLAGADDALEVAETVGYPLMLKAAAGGGGKGMRVVRERGELTAAFESASREAMAAFGDGSIYIERFLEGPRHIEIQVLADGHGKVVHLGERECSIQRRHQKMIEEAPSPVVDAGLRERMGEAAVAAARAVDYRNAGTVEFLYQDGEFYFLEMNTRIQVEHPVTELVTGVDLVQWQLRIAGGEPLALDQADIGWTGHAIECRITSEDSYNGFLPSSGVIELFQPPAGPGVRWDGGIREGDEVSLFYDPLLAKLVVHATTRELAIQRMLRALEELRIVGVETSAPFHRRVLMEPDFRAGHLDIRYIDTHPELLERELAPEAFRACAVTAALLAEEEAQRRAVRRVGPASPTTSRWRDLGWR
jgi:acetyl-CoA carboxylase, biotin carboxylase subunit